MNGISVALVDDQALFRAGVRMLLESQDDLIFSGEAGDGRAGIELAERVRPDVLLMDVRMPGTDGIAATERVLAAAAHGQWRAPRIIVLTTFDHDEYAARALRAGASGFVLKDATPEFLLASIRTVHDGNAVVSASATMDLLQYGTRSSGRRPAPAAWTSLTNREHEIFALAARGLSNSEIAASEFVSEATVKTHVSRILAKLGVRDRVQLVVFSYEHDLDRVAD